MPASLKLRNGNDTTSDRPDFSLPCWTVVREDAKDTHKMEKGGKDSANEREMTQRLNWRRKFFKI